jgi:YVTN family beta-propeller protein
MLKAVVELPSGTVTFLFTDIEGSTRLLKNLRDGYGDVLAEHERMLREAFADAGGQEIDTQGDAFFVAFRRARDAVAAAVAAQRALAEHRWPHGSAVRVRMGIHSGEPMVGSERYVGLGVHRAARICAAAHGGQVLLSETARGLVEDDLPADVRLRDLGEHRLKDLDRAERLFQLDVDGLQTDFPPPTAERGDPDALVSGRERELAEAARAAVSRFPLAARRRPLVASVAAVTALAAVAALVVVLTRGGTEAEAAGIEANSLGLIDARTNKVRRQAEFDTAPVAVAVGAGAVWVTNANNGTVSRIDPDTGNVAQTIPVGPNPNGIAVAGGTVWVASHDAGTVSRISPDKNAVVQEIPVGSGPTAVASGLGSVWVTNATDRTLSRIDARSGRPIKTITTNAVGRGVAVGGGFVWVTDESSRAVVQIDPTSNEAVGTVPVGNGPTGIAFGGGGLWVANSLDGTVMRINAATALVNATVEVPGGPSGIAVSKDAVWVSAEFGERLVKIDPHATPPGIVDSFEINNRPKGLAVARGGCWVAVQASGSGHRGGRLVVITDALIAVDPHVLLTTSEASAVGLLYDGLTAPRRTGGADSTQIVPDLATSVPAPTDGGRRYTFRIRSNVRYSDGRVVRAEDFRRSAERGLMVFPDAIQPLQIVGSDRCKARKPCDLSRGVIVRGDTVMFRLRAPNPHFLLQLATLPPIPSGTPNRSIPKRPPLGTGPYMVETFVPKRELRLVRNPRFRVWGPAARPDGYADEIVWRVGKAKQAVKEVAAGRADILIGATPGEQVPELKARYGNQLHLVPQNATTFLFLNTRQRPFDDVRVRQAINFAVDRAKVAALHGGADLAQPTCQVLPPTLLGYVRFCPYTIDPNSGGDWKAADLETAKKLIAASRTAGTRVVVWSWPYFAREGRYVVGLLRSLGYPAELHYVKTVDAFFEAIQVRHPQAGLAGWFGLQDPDDQFGTLSCGSALNWADFCDPTFDRDVRRLSPIKATNPSAAADLAARIDRTITGRAPWVPLFTPRLPDFVSKRVGNYQYNLYDNGVLLDQLWVR